MIAADYVAWLDQRRKLALPDSTSKTPRYATDIFLLDRRTGEVRRVTNEPAEVATVCKSQTFPPGMAGVTATNAKTVSMGV